MQEVRIPCGYTSLSGDLTVPEDPIGIVIFAHGSGSSRLSSRNRSVASRLQQHGIATLLLDLLTADEERSEARDGHLRFDIALLSSRLLCATEWLRAQPNFRDEAIGFFGASTGAGAALVAASKRTDIACVVSRGGRPDLAGPALRDVTSPTLLIVGEADPVVMRLNREAEHYLQVEKSILTIPRATHLFEEAGALEQVADAAAEWFVRWFAAESETARAA
jgi:dienelactone hydrolase